MTIADREHAAQLLLAFLGQVGPLEAIWAFNTALESLGNLPASADHVAVVRRSFAETLSEWQEPPADPKHTRKKAAAAPAAPAAEGDQP